MSWTNDLVQGINTAISLGGKQNIVVHTEAQKELGLRAISRLLSEERVKDISFVIMPEQVAVGHVFTKVMEL